MLIKYRFKSVQRQGNEVYALVDRLANLGFFESWRTASQKAWDEARFNEEECVRILNHAKGQSPQTFRSTYVIEQMGEALAALRAYKSKDGLQ